LENDSGRKNKKLDFHRKDFKVGVTGGTTLKKKTRNTSKYPILEVDSTITKRVRYSAKRSHKRRC